MMRFFSADYIFPISSEPVKNGIIAVDEQNCIQEILHPETKIDDVKRFEGIICPGFINSHCHLELSYLKGKIPEHTGLNSFITSLEKIRKTADPDQIAEAAAKADREMEENGIVSVGDISNTNFSFKAKQKSSLYYHTFVETFSSNPDIAEIVFEKSLKLYSQAKQFTQPSGVSITPHATYSLSKKLFSLIKTHALENKSVLSMHHQESDDEIVFFMEKQSPIMERQKLFGVEKSDFAGCGKRPLQAVSGHLPSENPLLLVHNTVSTADDIDYANSVFKNCYWCLCPNANLFIETKLPDIGIFYKNNCLVTIGTDSYASNKQLSVLEEIKTIQKNNASIPLNELLKWGTLNGACFLEINKNYGSFEKGKKPGLNLITEVDLDTMRLTKNSAVKKLV